MDFFKIEKIGKKSSDLEIKERWKKCFDVAKMLVEKHYGKEAEKNKYNFFCINIAEGTITADSCIKWVADFMNCPERVVENLNYSDLVKQPIKLDSIGCFTFDQFDVSQIWIGFAGKSSKVGMRLKSPFEGDTVDFSDYQYVFELFYKGKAKYYEDSEIIVFDLSFFK